MSEVSFETRSHSSAADIEILENIYYSKKIALGDDKIYYNRTE